MLALIVAPAAGTTLVRKNLAQLTREADAIIVARVLATSCAWNRGHTLIWTENQVEILETWKGKVPVRLSVMEPGGIVHPVGQRVAGMARYRVGDTVVIFLKKDVLGQWRTHGCIQGAFPLTRSKDGSMKPVLGKYTTRVVQGFVARDAGLPAFHTRVKALLGLNRRGK